MSSGCGVRTTNFLITQLSLSVESGSCPETTKAIFLRRMCSFCVILFSVELGFCSDKTIHVALRALTQGFSLSDFTFSFGDIPVCDEIDQNMLPSSWSGQPAQLSCHICPHQAVNARRQVIMVVKKQQQCIRPSTCMPPKASKAITPHTFARRTAAINLTCRRCMHPQTRPPQPPKCATAAVGPTAPGTHAYTSQATSAPLCATAATGRLPQGLLRAREHASRLHTMFGFSKCYRCHRGGCFNYATTSQA